MSSQEKRVDPITFEVIRNKLTSIIHEQTITIQHISGSPIVTEATDFNNGIFLPDGTPLDIGYEAMAHANSIAAMVRATVQECSENPGINEDDQFFCNCPWRGALHQSDGGIIAPIFYEGELVAWSGALTHQIDMGGMEFGSWCPKATEVYQEAVPMPPIKLMEKGELRRDLWNMLMVHTRLPFLTGLDFRAMIGANNTGKREFVELADRYGIDTVKAVMEGMLDETEQKLRARLREIPDGTYSASVFLDHDGFENRLYRVMTSITKEGDHLIIDFTGTSPQAQSFINCSRSTLTGFTAGKIWDTLCFDIPWNGGVFRVFEIIAPDGMINTAQFPAPISSAPCAAGFATFCAVFLPLSKMLACTDKYKKEAAALSNTSLAILNLGGLNQYKEPFGTMLLDGLAGGEGAWSHRDGVSAQSHSPMAKANISDVETNENFAPMLYLHRRLVEDGCAAGKWRGGAPGGLAFTIHDVDSLGAVLVGHGPQVPHPGMFGGLPGGCSVNTLVRNSDILEMLGQGELVTEVDELKGKKMDLGAKPGAFLLAPGDVLEFTWQGGGGYGDPLERDPERVLEDVVSGLVHPEWATKLYGVVIDEKTMQVDANQTNEQRKRILGERLALTRDVPKVPQADIAIATRLMPIGEYLEVIEVSGQKIIKCRCGYQFGPIAQNWKDHAARVAVPPNTTGPFVKCHDELEIRHYICPSCGLLLDTEVARKDEPPLWDIKLKI